MVEPVEPVPPSTPPAGVTDTEPVAVWLVGLVALINAGLALADNLDWINTTPEQTAAIGAFITALTAIVGSFVRGTVYSPATVERLTHHPVT